MKHAKAELFLRPLELADLSAALAIQSEAYPPSLIEDAKAFASRLNQADSFSLAATRQGKLVAYLLAHPWQAGCPPGLNAHLHRDGPAEVLLIHDLAVSPSERGSGVGRQLAEAAMCQAAAKGLDKAELIAVDGAASFWTALGFAEALTTTEITLKLATYGQNSKWMRRQIQPHLTAQNHGQ